MTSTIIAAAAAILAGISVFVAVAANRRADTANTIADGANTIAEDAKNIARDALDHQRQYAPAPWGQATLHSESGHRRHFRILNSSGREIVLHSAVCASGGVSFESGMPDGSRVEYGDGYPFSLIFYVGQQSAQVTLSWSFADDATGEVFTTVRTASR